MNSPTRRRLKGCYYFGCFTPLAFATLAVLIGIEAIRNLFRRDK